MSFMYFSSFTQNGDTKCERIGRVIFRHRSIFFGALLLAVLLFCIDDNAIPAYGAGLIVLGLLMRFVAVLSIGSRSRTQIPKRGEESLLVTSGLYSITRNPLYVANIVLWTGVVIFAGLSTGCIVVLVTVISAYWLIIRYEESAWSHVESYNAYCSRVPRWPSLGGIFNSREEVCLAISVSSKQWFAALRSELPSILATVCCVAVIGATNVS